MRTTAPHDFQMLCDDFGLGPVVQWAERLPSLPVDLLPRLAFRLFGGTLQLQHIRIETERPRSAYGVFCLRVPDLDKIAEPSFRLHRC